MNTNVPEPAAVSGSDDASRRLSSQILSVHAQVWSVRSGPQGDTHRLPVHHAHQNNHLTEKIRPQEEPQRLLHQLSQLRHLLHQRQTQPSRTGEN